MDIVGRKDEIEILSSCLDSKESRLIALTGRRRVGKTYLIREYFGNKIKFEIAGLHDGTYQQQLSHVYNTIKNHKLKESKLYIPENWMEAFDLIKEYLNTLKGTNKKVIFIDEMPWFETHKSRFLMAFENFWNSYCTKRKDLIVVVCGSSASWVIKKIVRNKGGLHNRISERINLKPFTLLETESFLKSRNIKMSRYDIVQLYMVTGGVPFYLDRIRKGESFVQFVERVCFRDNGFLKGEYQELLKSLFKNSQNHELILKTLANKFYGLSRNDLAKQVKLSTGGTLTEALDELEESGFITKYHPFGTKINQVLFRLTDHFILFHHQFMAGNKQHIKSWKTLSSTSKWTSWAGISFELICANHQKQIIKALGLQAIECGMSPWKNADTLKGAQVDLIIERADRIINLCEIKFLKSNFTLSKSGAVLLRNKVTLLSEDENSKGKVILLTLISTFPLLRNGYTNELIDVSLTMEELFL